MNIIRKHTRKLLEFFEMEMFTAKDILRTFYFVLSFVNVVIMANIGSTWILMTSLLIFAHSTWQFLNIGRNIR